MAQRLHEDFKIAQSSFQKALKNRNKRACLALQKVMLTIHGKLADLGQ